ncbi:hypothetical protein FRC08_006900 [Ceratobasidium sp. 394]|nr:hypothetical protein FRC08_006900 [Ceratobasidium sp. 394]
MESMQGSTSHAPKPFRGPWEGENKIVIGIDIGTTQSGVAFTYLQEGADQVIYRVTRWPGQEAQSQQGKIPSIIWYDSSGKAVSFGAEALSPQAEDDADDQGWRLAKYFKLHLHPDDMKAKHDLKLEDLPVGVTLQRIYSDFMGYLLRQTQEYFEERILDGKQIWETYRPKMEIVLAHPNGWGLREQAFLRSAAVEAKLADAESAPTRIRFVTEAEASVHFCIYHTNLGSCLQPGTNFVVCDAGGSTVDTTLYTVVSARPVLKLEEKRASACVQAGAIFVDSEAEKYLRTTLRNAQVPQEDIEEYTKAGVKDFEAFAKRAFGDPAVDSSIAIAQSRFNNASIRTRRGRMTLPGSIMKSFFDAVADGAVIWNTISSVYSRAPRASFGVVVTTIFDPDNSEHRNRIKTISPDGIPRVIGAWCPIVTKGVPIDAKAVCREGVGRFYMSPTSDPGSVTMTLFSYSGEDQPNWALDSQGTEVRGFRKACTIVANLQNISNALTTGIGIHGRLFWVFEAEVCIRFGGTELQAYLEWEEEGVTRTGPATFVPEDNIEL